MTSFISSLGRVPNILVNRTSLNAISGTNAQLFQASQQLATGRQIVRPSQDAVAASVVADLDRRLQLGQQRIENLNLAENSLNTIDDALRDASDLLDQANSIALSQIGAGASESERADQAIIIRSIIDGMARVANRESIIGYVFGGQNPQREPVQLVGEAYAFTGERGNLVTDAGTARSIPVTVGAPNAIGAIAGRIAGTVDYGPQLTADTRVADIRGAAGSGVERGEIRFSFAGSAETAIDLSGTDTVGDVVDQITAAIREYENDNAVTILGPGSVSIVGTQIFVDSPNGDLEFMDIEGATTARDLGLRTTPTNQPFNTLRTLSVALSPKLTLRTPLNQLAAIPDPLESIRVTQNGVTTDIDLSSAATIGDVKSLIESQVEGVRVEVNQDGNTINILSTLSGTADTALRIEEVPGNNTTASRLGIRSLTGGTPVSTLNFGRGVTVNEGETPAERNTDFTITLGDGFEIDINLTNADLTTVSAVIGAINTQANTALTAAGRPTTDFVAALIDGPNGIALTQDTTIGGPITVAQRHNSLAAEQLGLLDGTFDTANNRWIGEDRGAARAESVFTTLLDLERALQADDDFGMQLATEKLKASIDGVAQDRALMGGFAQRARNETARQEDKTVIDQELRAGLQDLDFAEAASRFSLLQTQLEAGLRVTSLGNQLTLLNFL